MWLQQQKMCKEVFISDHKSNELEKWISTYEPYWPHHIWQLKTSVWLWKTYEFQTKHWVSTNGAPYKRKLLCGNLFTFLNLAILKKKINPFLKRIYDRIFFVGISKLRKFITKTPPKKRGKKNWTQRAIEKKKSVKETSRTPSQSTVLCFAFLCSLVLFSTKP
jgi:hypothetical protein